MKVLCRVVYSCMIAESEKDPMTTKNLACMMQARFSVISAGIPIGCPWPGMHRCFRFSEPDPQKRQVRAISIRKIIHINPERGTEEAGK